MIGTLAVDGWTVTFGTAPSPLIAVPNVTAHQSDILRQHSPRSSMASRGKHCAFNGTKVARFYCPSTVYLSFGVGNRPFACCKLITAEGKPRMLWSYYFRYQINTYNTNTSFVYGTVAVFTVYNNNSAIITEFWKSR